MSETKFSVAFDAMCRLHQALGVPTLKDMGAPWVHRLDERWTFAVNGQRETHEVTPEGAMSWPVPPIHCVVWYNGWFAGEFSPSGGIMAAGAAGNEESLIAALERAIEEAG